MGCVLGRGGYGILVSVVFWILVGWGGGGKLFFVYDVGMGLICGLFGNF